MSDYGDDDGGYVEERYEEYREEEEEREEREERSSESGSDHGDREDREDRPYYEQEAERDNYAGAGYPGESTRAYGGNSGYPGAQGGYSSQYNESSSNGHGNAFGAALGGGLLGGVLGAAASKFGGGSKKQNYEESYQPQQSSQNYNNYPPSSGYQSHDNYQSQSGNYQSQGGYDQGYRNAPHAPPEGKVQFGHGAPSQYQFAYSNCTGRRKALLVGINYLGQKGQLNGCINDVHNVSSYLIENFGYQRRDMVILTDDQQEQNGQPTKANIERAMRWLVDGAQVNDSLFFHYSGHGGSTKDLNGDEEDGNDEVIYPVDYETAGHILDDEMHTIMVNPLQAGVRLTCIFDSCHSGSALDLPYMYSTAGVIKEPNLAKEAGEGLLNVFTSANTGDYGGAAKHVFDFFKQATISDGAREKTIATKTSPADVIMWSGSKDDQTSADATINAKATGAMSWAFIGAMKKNPQQSYVQLLNSIREVLQTKYTQKPQLSSSHPIDTDLLFIM